MVQEKTRSTKRFCLCSKTYCCCESLSNKFKFGSKGLTKQTFEDSGDALIAKYQKALDETKM